MNEPRRITERYRLEKRVSSKASSSVFRAADTLSGDTVAVKLINTGDLDGSRAAFEAHLATLQEIRHPALPRIVDFGRTTAGSLFLVTEYLDGDDLGDLVEIPPARVLTLLLQLVDGLEAVAARGLTLRNLSAGNVRLVKAPDGEQVKILGLGSAAFLPAVVAGDRTDLRAFAHLAAETLGLSIRDDEGTMAVALPLEVAGALAESERLRELLEAGLRDDPGARSPDWKEVRQTLRTALFGTTGRPSAAPVSSDDTIALSRIGVAPAPRAGDDFTTRVFRPDDLTTDLDNTRPPAPLPPSAPAGPVRIPLREIEDASPPAGTLRFPAPPAPPRRPVEHDATMPRRSTPLPLPPPIPTPIPIPPPVPAAPAGARPAGASASLPAPPPQPPAPTPPKPRTAPSPATAPLAHRAAAARPGMASRRLALLIGLPVAVFLVVLGLVAWLSRRSAQPEPQSVQAQPAPQPASRPAPPATPSSPSSQAPRSIHPQILLAEEALSAGDPQKAGSALAAILPEQIAGFTAEEKDRYQRALEAVTPLKSQEWAERLKRGLANGDLRLLRTAAASPPAAATLTPEQKKGLTRARKILDLDKRLTRAQREKDHPETLRQAGLLLAELPGNAHARQARSAAADALLAEADARAGQAELDAALAALEHLREGWPDHPALAERLERLRAERRANDEMEEALAAAARAERVERPREGLEALDRVQPNERYAGRFQQARERLQAQLSELDRNPPQISLAGAADPTYEKGATVTIRLRVTDDQRIESVEAWVRPEGGRFTKVSVRPLGGSDYELEIGPDLHQNKNIDFYVTAADPSGHTSSLGSVQHPQKIKRKKRFF